MPIQRIIKQFGFTHLPVEGTLFRNTYRSNGNFSDGTPIATAILGMYCHEPLSHSSFHRLPHDEIWVFHDGDPLRLILLHPDGSSQDVILGRDFEAGQHLQFVIPAEVWQAGHVVDDGAYSLFGCIMAPGFTSATFEGADTASLLEQYPSRRSDILRFQGLGHPTRMPDDFAV